MAEKLIVIGGDRCRPERGIQSTQKKNLTWRFQVFENPDLSAMEPAVFPIL